MGNDGSTLIVSYGYSQGNDSGTWIFDGSSWQQIVPYDAADLVC
jgi:hypothetical protein